MRRISVVLSVCVAVCVAGSVYVYSVIYEHDIVRIVHPRQPVTHFEEPLPEKQDSTESLLFVGDVMLSRTVETLMRERGASYPFSHIRDYLTSHTYVFGNFEGTVPEKHIPTPSMGFSFSIDKSFIAALNPNGFTHMTLANNHAYDYGKAGHAHTRTVLHEAGISTHGSPDIPMKNDIAYVMVDSLRVAVIPVHAVFTDPSLDALRVVIAEASLHSDIQIISIHWGEEYRKRHTVRQQALAHALIDMGVDTIIGHHPHVIENIEIYKNVPIFYSLGNFVFDQYWYDEVKTGLLVQMTYQEPYLNYAVIPVYSPESAPMLMEGEKREKILRGLTAISDPSLKKALLQGKFKIRAPHLAIEP